MPLEVVRTTHMVSRGVRSRSKILGSSKILQIFAVFMTYNDTEPPPPRLPARYFHLERDSLIQLWTSAALEHPRG